MVLKLVNCIKSFRLMPIASAIIYYSLGRDAGEHCVDGGHHWPCVLGPGPIQHAQGGDGARVQSQSNVTHLIQSDKSEF